MSPVKGSLVVQKGTETDIDKAEREAERQKSILSTIEEEDQQSSIFDATPNLNGLGLHNPVMDFSSSGGGSGQSADEAYDAKKPAQFGPI